VNNEEELEMYTIPQMVWLLFEKSGLADLLSDEIYLKCLYRVRTGKKLDLKSPTRFNEKLQWLKLYDRKPLYTTLVDKYAVRQYIKDTIGEEYLIPLAGGPWESFDEIDFSALPSQFVLKCTHNSGGLIICRDKSTLDIDAARKKINKLLKRNYFFRGREWPYKNVPPRIIAEQYVTDGENDNLPVYKIFCFQGEPRIIQSIQNDKQSNESIDYFDTDWNLLKFRQNFPNSASPFARPAQLPAMLETARKLAKGMSFIRVDLYSINGEVKFSEYTFYSDSGTAKFEPDTWDLTLGQWLRLPEREHDEDE